MGTMEINEFNQEKLRLLDTEQLLAFYGIFGTLNSPRAKEMVAGISRELKRRNYALDEENEIDVKALLKGLGKGAIAAGKILKTAIKVTYPIAKDMVKGTWIISKKIGGAIGDLMDDSEFRKLFTKYIDNPEDPNRLKKIQAYTDSMLSDAPVSGMESVKMKKLRIEKVCSIVLGEDFNKDFIYEDVDFTKPSAIKEAYKLFESVKLKEAKKVIAQVELWNGKKIKKSFKDQSSAEKFIKNLQDTEDVRGYNMYAEGLEESATAQRTLKTANKLSSAEYEKFSKLKAFNDKDWKWNSKEGLYHRVKESTNLEEAPTDKYRPKDISMALMSAGIGTANVIKVRKLFKGSTADDRFTMKDINLALMSVIGPANISKVIKALRGRAVKEADDLEEATFYKPKANRESETITFVNDAEAKQAEKLFTSMKLKVKRSGKRISFINTAEFKSAKSKVMAESVDLTLHNI